jgi:TRAP-type C4-dicarboxylate transport system substrate-binding protein
MSRLVTALSVLALAAGLASGAHAQDRLKFKIIGQPLATGLIQKNKEQPFFENFAQRTGLPIDAEYKPIDTLGIKDTEQLRVMKAGLFDIVSLRVSQNSRDEPTILGLDLVGASPDYATGRKVAKAYFNVADERLQKQFNVKLLGVWPFGPQILFCKKPIAKLADVKGLKVRVYDQNLAKFIEMVGGTPVPISFADTHQSLSLGVVDCAITGPSSANSAGWPEVIRTSAGLPDGTERLRDLAEGLEPAQARPAAQAEGRL